MDKAGFNSRFEIMFSNFLLSHPTVAFRNACISTVWPSGLRRWLKAPVRKGVGSNPTAVMLAMPSLPVAQRLSISARQLSARRGTERMRLGTPRTLSGQRNKERDELAHKLAPGLEGCHLAEMCRE